MLQIVLLYLIFHFQSLSASKTSDEKDNLTLDLVQVIFRHGLRTPIKQEAKFINVTDSSIYGYDFGQLTKEGMQQEYTLGKLLRKHYSKHLGTYDEKKIVAKSTASVRARMSLELVLAGLFPPTQKEILSPELYWRPVPYEITASEADVILAPYLYPKFTDFHKKILENSEEYLAKLSNYTEFIKYLEKQTGHSYFVDVTRHCGWTAALLQVYRFLNITLPNWCTNEVYKTSEDLLHFIFDSFSLSRELRKLNGGTLIRQVIENVENNMVNDTKKIYLYSTHDLTLASFTKAQGIINAFEIPPFGSAYIVESYKDTKKNNYYIKMLSWNGSSDRFVELEIENCEKYCPVDKYKIMVKDVIPTDEELKFFSADTSGSSETLPRTKIALTTAVLLCILFVLNNIYASEIVY